MKDYFELLLQKIDNINKEITDIKVSQEKTEVIMDTHIKRTEIAEDNINILRKDMKPLKTHVTLVNNLVKFILAGSGILLFLDKLGWLKPLLALLSLSQ